MYIVGLTGGIGAGKTFVEKRFNALGIESVDSDLIAREVVAPGEQTLQEIALHFSEEPDILTPSGELNRKLLRKIIFSQPQEKTWLESLLHPLIKKTTRARLQAVKSPYGVLVSPLLIESQQAEWVDRVLVVDVPEAQQVSRAAARDKSTPEHIKSIVAQQMPRDEKLKHASDIIDNSKNAEFTEQQIQTLHTSYLNFAKNSQ